MINLLPPDIKQSIAYGRRNKRLLNFAVAGILVIGGLIGLIAGGHFYINKSSDLIAQDIAQTKQNLESQKLAEAEAQVEEISSQVKLVVQVLSREILFSKLIRQIGAAMPEGTALTSLDLTQVDGGIDLNATAIDTKAATQIQLNLQDPANKIFEKADINTIRCDSSGSKAYPCDVSLRALFGSNKQYYFITSGSTAP